MTAPYGSWRSPISAELVASGGVVLEEARSGGAALYWLEGRPAGIAVSSIVFGMLSVGGLAVADQVPKEMVDVLQAAVVLVAAATAGGWGRRR